MVTESEICATLIDALHRLANAFAPDELAFLATTTKAELPIRDRLGYLLYTEALRGGKYIVTREWQRFDLALLTHDGAPLALIELKCFYTFDMFAPKAASMFPSAVARDVAKLGRHASSSGSHQPITFTLLLATHLHEQPPKHLDCAIKYSKGIRRYWPPSREEALSQVDLHFPPTGEIARGELHAGQAFGIPVSVLYWLRTHRQVVAS